jgi:hypothetical protein
MSELISNPETLRREAPKAARIRQLRAKGDGILKIGRTLGIGTTAVERVVSQDAR